MTDSTNGTTGTADDTTQTILSGTAADLLLHAAQNDNKVSLGVGVST